MAGPGEDPVSLPLVTPIEARYASLTQDARLINCVAEKNLTGKGYYVYKRPGFVSRSTAIPAGTGLGIFNWIDDIYCVVGSTLYKNGSSLGAVDSTSEYYATAGLGATPKMLLTNTAQGYYVNQAGVVTRVTDVNFPPNQTPAVAMVGGVAYLDATFYVMDAGANIYGSNVASNDPSNWTPIATIVAQIEAQPPAGLFKQLVYILALKEYYSEAFYDSGNSPMALATVQGAKMNFGAVHARTVQDCGGDLIWVGATKEGSVNVIMASNVQTKIISTQQIERLLESVAYSSPSTAVWSWSARVGGHRFYGITSTVANFTLVYDLTSGLWYEWTDPSGNYLPYVGAVVSHVGGTNKTLFLHATSGATFGLDFGTYQDNGTSFPVDIYTPNYTGGSLRQKTLGRMDLVGDMVAGSTCNVSWSDDDFQTFTTPVAMDMSLARPSVSDLGSFFRRAFRLNHLGNQPFRIEQVDMWIDLGT